MNTKFLLSVAVLLFASTMTGCATAITSYRISNGQMECPPQVIADTSIGVSVHVNDDATCEQSQETEMTEGQQRGKKSLGGINAHRELVGVH
ncbi:hypothetical protein QTO08_00515 [Vibrio parahaemolyticus]|uniref:hypothetical protein n=1 Tax=Vibrio parahaemolyticus TaxID=670 RepID=UPI002F41A3E5